MTDRVRRPKPALVKANVLDLLNQGLSVDPSITAKMDLDEYAASIVQVVYNHNSGLIITPPTQDRLWVTQGSEATYLVGKYLDEIKNGNYNP